MKLSDERLKALLQEMESMADPVSQYGMKRFAIPHEHALGIRTPGLVALAKKYGPDHDLALALWDEGPWHECKLVAPMLAVRSQTTPALMDAWVSDFYSWDVCDQAIGKLFRYLPFAYDKVYEYAPREEEFVRRAAFSLIAELAVSDKKETDDTFLAFLPLIEQYATDDRNFVKKAVNWALRQTGKRNRRLHGPALDVSRRLATSADPAARWTGKDAVRELTDPKIIARIKI